MKQTINPVALGILAGAVMVVLALAIIFAPGILAEVLG